MTEASDAAAPPQIPGYSYIRPVGHGGFSDVYLYEQSMPRRGVAIKVLRTENLSDEVRAQFAAEANLMARVSNHSNIAAIYTADVDDDGEPFLVMEYCSGGSLGSVYRYYPMSVPDVLTLGVRLSGALEAAHRAGIVHRDIKPANILLTEYGVPVLSDFGISTIADDLPESTRRATFSPGSGSDETSVGMSLPWAAPEALWDSPISDTHSDQYSLAATLYSLLEGHSPQEVPGGPNSPAHIAARLQRGFVTSMQRSDVPPSLQAVLRQGLSYDREARFDNAATLGRALQQVQRDIGLEVTPLEVPRGAPAPKPPDVATRVQQQPLQLPEGHPTLLPNPEAAQQGLYPHQPSQAHPPTPPVPSQPLEAQQPVAQVRQPFHAVPALAAATTHLPGRSNRWRIAIGALVGVLLLGSVVGASLLIAQSNADPEYSGREVDNLLVEPGPSGVYEITIPPALPIPTESQTRLLTEGDSEPLADADAVLVSLDTATWDEDGGVHLNPLESANQDADVWIQIPEFTDALRLRAGDLRQGDIILIAAPLGTFANLHPDFEITDSDATLVVLQILDSN
ncbi:MAG: serine/threonine-protein kinase [Beutenbergiaceae bacterium]